MSDSKGLVERLRTEAEFMAKERRGARYGHWRLIVREAADHIEALEKKLASTEGAMDAHARENARLAEGAIEGFGDRWKIERDPEDGLVYITHPRCSLVGQGKDLADAAQNLFADMPSVFAAYDGRDDLSSRAGEMVEWLRDVGGFISPPTQTPGEG